MADTESGLLATSANYQLLVTKIFQPLNDRQISLILQTIAKKTFAMLKYFGKQSRRNIETGHCHKAGSRKCMVNID